MNDKIKQAVYKILEAECSKDKDGLFYTEIHAYYRDGLDDKSILKICQADKPREMFYEQITESYESCEWEYENEILKKIMDSEIIANAIQNEETTEDEITELFQ